MVEKSLLERLEQSVVYYGVESEQSYSTWHTDNVDHINGICVHCSTDCLVQFSLNCGLILSSTQEIPLPCDTQST